MATENKRIQYIDTAKFLGLLLVVFIHGYKEGVVISFAYAFHMPLFFFLNGMTFKPDNISLGDFLVKKIKGYLIPGIGLGLLCSLFDIIIRTIYNISWDLTFLLVDICKSINQIRYFSVWFLTALFFSDIFLFLIYHKFKKNIWVTGLGVFLLLGFGILYNSHTKATMVWNIDVAFFGTLFTYFGFLFTSKSLSFIYTPLISRRWLSLLVGAALMVGTFFLSLYIRNHTTMFNLHLDMFGANYGNYYLPLACALLGSIGFTILSRGITNFVFAHFVKYNLALLAVHQVLAFSSFKFLIAKEWWAKVAFNPPEDPQFILFTLTMMVYSIACAVALYYVIIITPFSFILNKPRYPLFEKIFRKGHL
ncbi:MAG: acyltransferase family protein [Fibrobacteraceae bacterium]|nr:acyltransferase family protein [Fibrobacteraceae bacterium]